MLSLDGCSSEVVAYETIQGHNFASLAYGNAETISGKNQVFPIGITISCTTKECNVATPYYSIYALLPLPPKAMALAYESWSLISSFEYNELTWKRFLLWKTRC